MESKLLSYVVMLLVAICLQGSAQKFKVDPKTNMFVDSSGSTRIFHGVNVVYKQFPWIPETRTFDPMNSLSQADMQLLYDLGFNVIRLGVMWPGVEPVRHEYNTTYISAMNDLINNLGNYGIYTIVDFHQDLLHPALCGEGIPDFALRVTQTNCTGGVLPWIAKLIGLCKSISDYNMKTDPSTGYPLTSECLKHSFGLFYDSPDVSSAFQSLYDDMDIQDALTEYWKEIAKVFKDNEYVLGYDLINEPWPGNIWNESKLIEPGVADRIHLQPLYKKLHSEIRSIDNETILFYETSQFPDTLPILGGITIPNGFNDTPGGVLFNDRHVLSYHIYCCASGANVCDTKGDPIYSNGCDTFNAEKMKVQMSDIKRLGGGGFMTEFGGCSDAASGILEIIRTTKLADEYFQSWSYWQFKYFHDITTQADEAEGFYTNGELQINKTKSLSRTYAQIIQGIPTKMSFDESSGVFELTYLANVNAHTSTLIFFNKEYYYPNGYSVELNPSNIVSWRETLPNRLEIIHSASVSSGDQISCILSPSSP